MLVVLRVLKLLLALVLLISFGHGVYGVLTEGLQRMGKNTWGAAIVLVGMLAPIAYVAVLLILSVFDNRSRRVATRFYLGWFALSFGLGAAASFSAAFVEKAHNVDEVRQIAAVFSLLGLVVLLVFLWQIWNAIQDDHTEITPQRALGFLFIPVFNIYWAFKVWVGWVHGYNEYCERQGLDMPKVDPSLFLCLPLLGVASMAPVVGPIIALANVVVLLLVVNGASKAVNRLPAHIHAPANASTEPGQ